MTGASERVAEAVQAVPRSAYLPWSQRRRAGADQPLRIGDGATCSQPSTVVRMLEMLDARPGDRVLDVGSGSGWTCALLAHMVAPGGHVHGVEVIPRLASCADRRLVANHVTNASVLSAVEGVLGLPEHGPFDRILVSAMASSRPQALIDQLGEGGRMVVPVAGRMLRLDHSPHGLEEKVEGHYRFVPLHGS
ncbi:MAG: protein-L-isoaspartate carboxylmethyltransferase [Ornithinimicrobium sp.]